MSEWPPDPRTSPAGSGWPVGPDHPDRAPRPPIADPRAAAPTEPPYADTEPPYADRSRPPSSWPGADRAEPVPLVPLAPPHGRDGRSAAERSARRPKVWRALAIVLGALLLVAVGAIVGLWIDGDGDRSAVDTAPVSSTEPAADDLRGPIDSAPAPPTPLPVRPGPVPEDVDEPVAAVAAAVAPAVVRIDTETGTGSGVIYDQAGLVVTNAHVVGLSTDVLLQLADGTRTSGTVVGVDPNVDIAVVRIDEELEFVVAEFASTSSVEVGQMAVAIGSPFGLEQSVTAGIISAINRAVPSTNVLDGTPTVVEMVQTDAPINPGNSGGALADRQGRVVGVNTSIRTDGTTQGNLGVGFAIPSDTAMLVAGRIVAGEPLDSGFLGVSGQDPTSGPPGALVTEVVPDGPADTAGLEPGDLIVGIDGVRIPGMTELAARIRLSPPGSVVAVEVEREGASETFDVTLGSLSD